MKQNRDHELIETLGLLTKEETLTTVKDNIVPNTFVLESLEPFPGYHGENLPTDTKPEALYLITSKRLSTEQVYRTVRRIQKFASFPLNAIPGEIMIYNSIYYCIRIRHIQKYEMVREIQK